MISSAEADVVLRVASGADRAIPAVQLDRVSVRYPCRTTGASR